MNTTYLLIGSNQGNCEQLLLNCVKSIEANCGSVTQRSHIYETAAWGLEDQPAFLNMALCVQTILTAPQLLSAIQTIEYEFGRQREIKWGQRTLDIDIIFYNDDIINEPELKIPHPYLQERRFVLVPLNDIAPQLVHPMLQKPVEQLLAECRDTLDAQPYIRDN